MFLLVRSTESEGDSIQLFARTEDLGKSKKKPGTFCIYFPFKPTTICLRGSITLSIQLRQSALQSGSVCSGRDRARRQNEEEGWFWKRVSDGTGPKGL